jgi:hypothetical protein
MDGILRCSRYAFGPNRLHYCGPDQNLQLGAHIKEKVVDPGLEKILRDFKTMYPYLRHIAAANGIRDPLDEKVVEAYWIGNTLLEAVPKQSFYRYLVEDLGLKKKMSQKQFDALSGKIGQGALAHHSFHVLNVWQMTGAHEQQAQTLLGLDECRISWGKVMNIDGPAMVVETEPLLYSQGKLFLGSPVSKKIFRKLESEYDLEQVKPGDILSMHWSVPCEVISESQADMLKKYTLRHIGLANTTL